MNKIDHPLHRIGKSLAVKLIFSIAALILIGGGFSWYLLISSTKENLIEGCDRRCGGLLGPCAKEHTLQHAYVPPGSDTADN